MSNPRIPVATLKQIIQFQLSELTTREIARALHLSQGAVSKYRQAVRLAGISAEEAQNLEDAELERRVWQARTARLPRNVVLPDCAWIHTQNETSQARDAATRVGGVSGDPRVVGVAL